jgi:ribonucleoside-diphosphate reductase alpha chain
MAVMSVDHPDFLEFIHCKDREGDISNFNISVGLTDEFMSKVASGSPDPWICKWKGTKLKPRMIYRDSRMNAAKIEEVTMSPKEIFQKHIVNSAWKTGEPGVIFLDTVNKSNPLPGLGRIEACNPCGEQFLHDGDVCNLGSINLEKFVTEKQTVDYEKLSTVTKTAVRMLDNVIDLSDFPVERVQRISKMNRRIGLGIMGFADMLYQMKIGYNTEQARMIARNVMGIIQKSAEECSEQLGKEKGNFPNYDYSVFADRNIPRRNAALTNVAPTGTISMMFDVSGGVEPYFALAYYYKGILQGKTPTLQYVNKHLRQALEEAGMFNEEIMKKIIEQGSLQKIDGIPEQLKQTYVTSMDISADSHVGMQAAFQEYCDNAISKTINFPNDATHNDIFQGFVQAWKNGCKGCTVYRDGSRIFQVLNLNKEESTTKNGEICPECGNKLVQSEGCVSCLFCGTSKCSL